MLFERREKVKDLDSNLSFFGRSHYRVSK